MAYNQGMEIDFQQLPIPDWDLACPRCNYPLRGLPSHRCPECGAAFVPAELVQTWTRVRPPRYTGHERPLPDFGLTCEACGAALAGAARNECPACGAPFDLERLRPPDEWFMLDSGLAGGLPIPGVQVRLAQEYIPHFEVKDDALRRIYGVQSMTVTRLRVAREFFFEVLWLLARTRREIETARRAQPWRCPRCGQKNPSNFEICWNCGAEESEG